MDGRGDEAPWKRAEPLSNFVLGWLGDKQRPARTATRARLLWDDTHLYFFADMDDADLYADVNEHDGRTWENDVFELFFKPSQNHLGYYEFQVNAANTSLDMYLPSRGSGGYRRWRDAHPFHMQTAVQLRGTLNKWKDKDEGWSVEGRIPWRDFSPTGGRPEAGEQWRFALCRYDYSIEFENPELSSTSPLTRRDFHRYEDYSLIRFTDQ